MRGKENTYDSIECYGEWCILDRGSTPDFELRFKRDYPASIAVDWLDEGGCIHIHTRGFGTLYVPYPKGDGGEACGSDYTDLIKWLESTST